MDQLPTGQGTTPNWVEWVKRHARALRFGVIQIVVHDGRVVQVEKTEKLRLDRVACPAPDDEAG